MGRFLSFPAEIDGAEKSPLCHVHTTPAQRSRVRTAMFNVRQLARQKMSRDGTVEGGSTDPQIPGGLGAVPPRLAQRIQNRFASGVRETLHHGLYFRSTASPYSSAARIFSGAFHDAPQCSSFPSIEPAPLTAHTTDDCRSRQYSILLCLQQRDAVLHGIVCAKHRA